MEFRPWNVDVKPWLRSSTFDHRHRRRARIPCAWSYEARSNKEFASGRTSCQCVASAPISIRSRPRSSARRRGLARRSRRRSTCSRRANAPTTGRQGGTGRRSDARRRPRHRGGTGRGRGDRLRAPAARAGGALGDEPAGDDRGDGRAGRRGRRPRDRGAASTTSCPTRCVRWSRASTPSRARSHVLVNDIWGATTMEWNKTVWESSLDDGLRTLRLARRHARHHQSLRAAAADPGARRPGRRGHRRHRRVQRARTTASRSSTTSPRRR